MTFITSFCFETWILQRLIFETTNATFTAHSVTERFAVFSVGIVISIVVFEVCRLAFEQRNDMKKGTNWGL